MPQHDWHEDVSILASAVNLLFSYCFGVTSNKPLEAISSQVALLLKEARESRGLSLNVLAQKAGLARQTISYVEQEVQSPSLDTLLRVIIKSVKNLARRLNVVESRVVIGQSS